MRPLYTPASRHRAGLPGVFLASALLTLGVFLILPLTQMVSARRQSVLAVRPADLAQIEDRPETESPPPPPPPEAEPPPEPPPALAEASQPLNLSVSLDVALGSGGAMATAASWLQEAVSQTAGAEAFSVADLERRPEVLNTVPPAYPEALRKARVEGAVTLAFVLNESGRVVDPRVENATHKEFEAAALEAIRKWKFKPGLKDGQPVRTYLRQTIRFRLPEAASR
jgi:protein TonB